MDKETNILVTGNGFDIHHGLKTKYTDFLKFIKEYRENKHDRSKYMQANPLIPEESFIIMNKCRNNNFINYFLGYNTIINGWIDLELLIRDIIKYFIDLIKIFEENFNRDSSYYFEYDRPIKILNNILSMCFTKILNKKANSFALNEKYWNKYNGINKELIIDSFRKELDELRDILNVYLAYFETTQREYGYKSEIKYKQIESIKANQVITFNYTNTYQRYGLDSSSITFLHGNLENSKVLYNNETKECQIVNNNLVLGFNDDNEDELDFVYFKKYVQCIIKHTDLLSICCFAGQHQYDSVLEESHLNGTGVNVHIFGHSLDASDKEKLLLIFNQANRAKIYYLNHRDYEIKVINVIKLLGKETAVNKIHSKNIEFLEISLETVE